MEELQEAVNQEDAQSSEHVSSEDPMEELHEVVNQEDAQSSERVSIEHVPTEHVPSESSKAPLEDHHVQQKQLWDNQYQDKNIKAPELLGQAEWNKPDLAYQR